MRDTHGNLEAIQRETYYWALKAAADLQECGYKIIDIVREDDEFI